MVETNNSQPNSIFVIRFYRSYQDKGPYWRGRIEHVQSSKWLYVIHLEDMLNFIRSFDIDLEWGDSKEIN